MSKVLVVGSTGSLGSTITQQLAKAGVDTTALVRTTANGQPNSKIGAFKQAGVRILESSLDGGVNEITKILKQFDTIVSALSGPNSEALQLKLIEAAKVAGTIKRFIPSEFGSIYPRGGRHAALYTPGLQAVLGGKDRVLDALEASGIPYTKVVNYAFFDWTLPVLGDIKMGPPTVPTTAKIYGTGDVKGAFTSEADIGRVVARAVDDPRTANKMLVIKVNRLSQHDLVAIYERVSSKQLEITHVTPAELDAQIKGSEGFAAFLLSLLKMACIDGAYNLPIEELTSKPFVLATELYPDIQFQTAEEYYKNLVAASG